MDKDLQIKTAQTLAVRAIAYYLTASVIAGIGITLLVFKKQLSLDDFPELGVLLAIATLGVSIWKLIQGFTALHESTEAWKSVVGEDQKEEE